MGLLTIVFIALGLAMDAFAVSIVSGFTINELRYRHAFRIAFFFGFFQALMPLIGWIAGLKFLGFLSMVGHWVAFALLSAIGGKMIYESYHLEEERKKVNPLHLPVLVFLSVATSIDALAVGLTFAFLQVTIMVPVVIIGCITFIISFAGVLIGDRFGHFFEKNIEKAGGIILICIGLKILTEHYLK